MRVLVIGSGAREHALCVALSADPAVTALACAPGNAGTRALAEPLPVAVGNPDAVAAAIDDGRLDPARYTAWRKLQAEAHRQALRSDARARAEEHARVRALHRSYRTQPNRMR